MYNLEPHIREWTVGSLNCFHVFFFVSRVGSFFGWVYFFDVCITLLPIDWTCSGKKVRWTGRLIPFPIAIFFWYLEKTAQLMACRTLCTAYFCNENSELRPWLLCETVVGSSNHLGLGPNQTRGRNYISLQWFWVHCTGIHMPECHRRCTQRCNR